MIVIEENVTEGSAPLPKKEKDETGHDETPAGQNVSQMRQTPLEGSCRASLPGKQMGDFPHFCNHTGRFYERASVSTHHTGTHVDHVDAIRETRIQDQPGPLIFHHRL